MKKSLGKISALILLLAFFASNGFSQDAMMDKIFFVQDGKKIDAGKTVVLENKNFEIHFSATNPDDYVSIFATTNFNYRHDEPTKSESIHVNDTVMFNPGTYIIKSEFNPNEGASIYIEDSYGFNGFSAKQRINVKSKERNILKPFFLLVHDKNQDEAVIPVTAFKDASGLFTGDADFYFYVDYNHDNRIDENEFTKMRIKINGDGNLYKNQKAYISTMGYRVRKMISSPDDGKYHLYVIESVEGFKKFRSQITEDVFTSEEDLEDGTIRLYILHSPVTNSIQISQPYHLTGTDNLIFEIETNAMPFEYVFARNYKVEKQKDRFTIYIKTDGGLIQPIVHRMD